MNPGHTINPARTWMPLVALFLASLALPSETWAVSLDDFGFGHMRDTNHLQSTRPLLLVLVEFTNGTALAHNTNWYNNMVFNPTTQPRSVNGYFKEVSNDRFSWSRAGTVLIRPPTNERYAVYLAAAGGNGRLADWWYTSNLVRRAIMDGPFNICDYDTNSDGVVRGEELAIVFIGNDGGGGMRHPGRVDAGLACARDGWVALQDHQGEFATLCHELSHTFGTLDFYGMNEVECFNDNLTLMCCTITFIPDDPETYHLDPWHKMQYGWDEPRIRSLPAGGVENVPAAASGDVSAPLLLYDPNRGTQEFFLVEYRAATNYDLNVAGNGVVIWHVQQDTKKEIFWLADAVIPNNAQNQWWGCGKCYGMFYQDIPSTLGPCPSGGDHTPFTGNNDYRLVKDDPAAPGQHGWRYCNKCQGLFYGPNQASSVCPDGGTHDGSGSFDYAIETNNYAACDDTRWSRCNKCQGLFYNEGTNTSFGVCSDHSGSGQHNCAGNPQYGPALRMLHYTLAAEGAPNLQYGSSAVWGSGMTTPELLWHDRTSTHMRIRVYPFAPGAAGVTVQWISDQETWVDFNYAGPPELGTFDEPFNTFGEGVTNVGYGGTVRLKTGHHDETPRVTKPMTLRGYNGPAAIGR